MRRARDNRGVTLVETVIATVIVALLGGAVMSAARAVLTVDDEARRSWQAGELGLALLEEIAALPFDDPQTGEAMFGPETGEWTADQTRALFDDVDDYDGWDGFQPLQQKDGTPIDLPQYRRAVSVDYVDPSDFRVTPVYATDYKKITVTVLENNAIVARFVTVRVQGGRDVDLDG
jgi:type II secretory pathway pseudopilin PulG